MKFLFCILLLLVHAFAFCQTTQKRIKSDSTYLYFDKAPETWENENEDSIWYMKRIIVYVDGSGDSPFMPLGDSLTAYDFYKNVTIDENRQVAQAAAITLQRQRIVRTAKSRANALGVAGLGDMYAGIDSVVWKEYLDPKNYPSYSNNFDVTENGIVYSGQMRRLDSGNYRLTFNGKNYRILFYAEGWARIQNYPSSNLFIDVFRIGQHEWSSVNSTVTASSSIPSLLLKKKR